MKRLLKEAVSHLKSSHWTDVIVVNSYCHLHTDLHSLHHSIKCKPVSLSPVFEAFCSLEPRICGYS